MRDTLEYIRDRLILYTTIKYKTEKNTFTDNREYLYWESRSMNWAALMDRNQTSVSSIYHSHYTGPTGHLTERDYYGMCYMYGVYSTMLCHIQLCTVFRALQYSSSVSFCSSCSSLWKQHGVLEKQPLFWWFLKTQPHTYMYTYVSSYTSTYIYMSTEYKRINIYRYVHTHAYVYACENCWGVVEFLFVFGSVCVCHLCCTVVCGSSFSTGLAWARTLANTSSTYDTNTCIIRYRYNTYLIDLFYSSTFRLTVLSYSAFVYFFLSLFISATVSISNSIFVSLYPSASLSVSTHWSHLIFPFIFSWCLLLLSCFLNFLPLLVFFVFCLFLASSLVFFLSLS